MKDTHTHMTELVAVAAPSWAGEAEIVRTYLAEHRTPARDLVWLKAQAWKEPRLLRVLSKDKQEEFLTTGAITEHPEGAEALRKLAEEIKHFRLLADLIAHMTGTPVALDDLVELPEETKLQALRAPYRQGTALERAVVNFTEGGGGAIYAVLGRLEGGEPERRMAAVFREIHDDEIFHGPAQIHTIARVARGPEDWERAQEIVRQVCHQRLRMRNEMFSFPLRERRLGEIAAGKIEPWPMPIAL